MKRIALAVSFLLAGALLMAADSASDITTYHVTNPTLLRGATADGGIANVAVDPSGNLYSVPRGPDGGAVQARDVVPCYARTFGQVATLVSTGPTNNGTVTGLTAGSCLQLQCSVATYIGATATLNADGGPAASVPSCLSMDGGSVFGCIMRSANEIWNPVLGPTENAIAGVSVAGTTSCTVSVAKY